MKKIIALFFIMQVLLSSSAPGFNRYRTKLDDLMQILNFENAQKHYQSNNPYAQTVKALTLDKPQDIHTQSDGKFY